LLEETMQMVLEEITKIRNEMAGELGMDPVEHLLGRIKSEESMREKCRRKGLPETPESALEKIHDAIGLRVVCAFLDDIYTIRDRLLALPRIRLVEEKDYIRHVKPNGYRSFHMIIIVDEKIYAEIQLRTISMDTWAALEHHLKYKKEIGGNTALISAELKRCADELASTDSSMQTLRDMIRELH
jgi:ppGpp synthetase/RelA/SpoT-type nucleotidyltranferase